MKTFVLTVILAALFVQVGIYCNLKKKKKKKKREKTQIIEKLLLLLLLLLFQQQQQKKKQEQISQINVVVFLCPTMGHKIEHLFIYFCLIPECNFVFHKLVQYSILLAIIP